MKKKAAGKKVGAKKKVAAPDPDRLKPGPEGFLGKWRLLALKLREDDRQLVAAAAEAEHLDISAFVRKILFAGLKKRGYKPSGEY